ncbi:MAG TPA: ABC transporter permease subunit [Planctomycetota bacterium]|nr:ABC transporter permease subunit [Planctomycetota bacterium]
MTSPTPREGNGHAGRRETRSAVRIAERVARLAISVGGIGTILAVAGILVFLLWVVGPLFLGARVEAIGANPMARPGSTSTLVHATVEEGGLAGWSLQSDGTLQVWRADTGFPVERRKILVTDSITASAFPLQGTEAALGFGDGKILLPRIALRSEVFDETKRPDLVEQLGSASRGGVSGELFERVPGNQLRLVTLDLDLGAPIETGLSGRVRLVDLSESGERRYLCALSDAGPEDPAAKPVLLLLRVERTENLLSGEVSWATTRTQLPFEPDRERGTPTHLLLSGGGDLLYLAWDDGHLVRYDLRDADRAAAVEEVELFEDRAVLTDIRFLIGKNTLMCGDSRGRVRAWFPTKPPDARTLDGIQLTLGHSLCDGGPAITALAASQRNRVVAAGDEKGGVRLWHVTSASLLASIPPPADTAPGVARVDSVEIDPKEDGLLAIGSSWMRRWKIDLRHPEAAMASLFTRVWYEGYPRPEHVWQSTGGTADFEPKLGLVPLVFGTLKATLYSMLFAVPLALLAAIFTSQFLSPKLRSPIKSTVEMMASLPSVVLGFLAAIVVAPVAARIVPATLAAFLTVPFALLFGARLWQLLPARISLRLSGLPRIAAMTLALVGGFWFAFQAGPAIERLLFAGDLLEWLDHRRGTGFGGWIVLLLPISAIVVALGFARTVDPWLRRTSLTWERGRCARVDLLKFLAGALLCVGVAWTGARILDGLWLDPRGGILDSYVQRNAMVVGFVMGFAVVPIVYTLAEDALSSVPAHLRLASLGAGATPWQTAVRIVIPTAASGLFSAIMVGLGRAVGETMIVLMATGNTPVMSWNIFNGFRTLSANIAVELPEAVRNSTHYRTLFLAALCLFAITFFFNTIAETVRQRFRRRAFQL